MRALVTGGTGFIGRRLVGALVRAGWSVCCLVRRPCEPVLPGVSVVVGDLRQDTPLALSGPFDAVFNLGALLPDERITDPGLYLEVNATAVMRLVHACEKLGVGRFVQMSSIAVIGQPCRTPIDESHPLAPASAYALGKLGGETVCDFARRRGMAATAFRLASPYGPGMSPHSILPLFVRRARAGQDLCWHGSGSRSQDFIHVDDVVAACLRAVSAPACGTYCLGSGQATSMRQLAELTASLFPGVVARGSGQPDPQDGWNWQLDVSAASRDLGFVPAIPIGTGLADFVAAEDGASWQWWS